MADVGDYLALATSEHQGRPRFVAMLAAVLAPLVDAQNAALALPRAFDLNTAAGVQLDAIGLWVGRTRGLRTVLPDTWFSWNTAGLGWNEANWKGPYDSSYGATMLDDEHYRMLLRGKIAANAWDGTTDGIVTALQYVLPANTITVTDGQDMTMTVAIGGPGLSVVEKAILTGDYIPIRPEGVSLTWVFP